MKFKHKYICVQPRTKLAETPCKIASVSSKVAFSFYDADVYSRIF